MDQRLLIGAVVVTLGVVVSKRIARSRQWLILCEFVGGPHDGEKPELTAEGDDPVRAFIAATENGDIEKRVKMSGSCYSVDFSMVKKVGAGTNAAVKVCYVLDGLDL